MKSFRHLHFARATWLIVAVLLGACGTPARAQPTGAGPVGTTSSPSASGRAGPELKFEPPPMPGFMLSRPDRQLSKEEMLRQAEEEAARVRQSGNADSPDSRATPNSRSGEGTVK